MNILRAFSLFFLFAAGARAQTPPTFVVKPSTFSIPASSTATAPSGVALDVKRGPWVIGDIGFAGASASAENDLRMKVRARKGILYTPEDVDSDVAALLASGQYLSVVPTIFTIPDRPVAPGYLSIAASSSQVRLLFTMSEKPLPPPTAVPASLSTSTARARLPLEPPPAAVSGVILTPTAYRGLGHFNKPGLGLDVNIAYYIGRLYGKNSFDYTLEKTNYLDRIGFWILSADGKMQLQSEGTWRPAAAAGTQVLLTFRDSPKPSLASNTQAQSVTVSQKTTRVLTDAYFVLSKNLGGVRTSAGLMEGNVGEVAANLTEFLSPESLNFGGHPNQTAQSKSVFFMSAFILPKASYPLGVEFFKPNGMALNPWLLNFKLGYFLHLNFDVAYLKYQGGYDLLGNFQFRFNVFPSR